MVSELTRLLRLDVLGSGPAARIIEATDVERTALARRFDLLSLEALTADLVIERVGSGIAISGTVISHGTQPCVISGLPVAFAVSEALTLRFERAPATPEEIELSDSDLDVLPLEGDAIDLGEIAAQALGLALDPYPKASPDELADYRLLLTSEEEVARAANPFAILGKQD